MRPCLISCIVPVFNGERYLREALESILGQTYEPLEVIVVDDGSTDGTAALVSDFGDQVRCLWQPNAGPTAARNLGLSAAGGEFMAFLDADDVWHPEKLTRQMARFQARPELDLCVTQIENFWSPELIEMEWAQHHRLSQRVPGFSIVTLLARRQLFEKIGQFNSAFKHGADTDWFLRAADEGAVMELLPDVLVYRRLHQSNRSRHYASASRNEYLQILKASLDRRRRRDAAAACSYEFPSTKRDEEIRP